jgi:hypothetical protein
LVELGKDNNAPFPGLRWNYPSDAAALRPGALWKRISADGFQEAKSTICYIDGKILSGSSVPEHAVSDHFQLHSPRSFA